VRGWLAQTQNGSRVDPCRTDNTETLTLRRVAAEDFGTDRRWYADALLNQHLGPMDDGWLVHALASPPETAAVASTPRAAVAGLRQ